MQPEDIILYLGVFILFAIPIGMITLNSILLNSFQKLFDNNADLASKENILKLYDKTKYISWAVIIVGGVILVVTLGKINMWPYLFALVLIIVVFILAIINRQKFKRAHDDDLL